MKPVHPDGFTNISYIQSSWYGHTKPFTVKRRQKPQYLSVTAVSQMGRTFVVKDMQQMLGRRKPRRTKPRQRY